MQASPPFSTMEASQVSKTCKVLSQGIALPVVLKNPVSQRYRVYDGFMVGPTGMSARNQ